MCKGVPNPALVMRTDGTLVGKITRSKTTGVGKESGGDEFLHLRAGVFSPSGVAADRMDS